MSPTQRLDALTNLPRQPQGLPPLGVGCRLGTFSRYSKADPQDPNPLFLNDTTGQSIRWADLEAEMTVSAPLTLTEIVAYYGEKPA